MTWPCKSLIRRAFAPHVSITASDDVTKVCSQVGAESLLELVAPFGESISGRITVRDSQSISTGFDDFAIRFRNNLQTEPELVLFNTDELEATLHDRLSTTPAGGDADLYTEFFKQVLSDFPVAPFETFSHPVAGVIAISSENQTPIETLSQLYKSSHEHVPEYIDKDYLRYYLLVHDETNSDLDTSIALFEKMKRSFGVHCHMVRINRGDKEQDNLALQQFTRELVASSVVPFMERCIATWNDQIASSRRGLTGRFFSASKKYFASGGGGNKSPLLGGAVGSIGQGNYNAHNLSYSYTSPEAQLRKLGDFAFMLRDYKFAHSTYDMLKRDFHNDKAWAHLAAAQEMAAVSWLMSEGCVVTQKYKTDTLDPLLDSATYSYISRCSLPTYGLRCILLASELLCTQRDSSPHVVSESSTKWMLKALNERLVGRLGYALLMQRVGDAFLVHNEICQAPRRNRKAAFWQLLAAREWSDASELNQSRVCLAKADDFAYKDLAWTRSATNLFGRLTRLELDQDEKNSVST